MEGTVRQLLNDVQRLVGEQQTQTATVAVLQRELQEARTTRGGNTRMDPLKLGKPPVFTGDETPFEDWAFKLKTFMGQKSKANDVGAMDA
eukprot:3057136-Amphidinium_carterae.1